MEPCRDRAAQGYVCVRGEKGGRGRSVCETAGSFMAVRAAKSEVNWRKSLAAELCNFVLLFMFLLFYSDSLGCA